MKIAFTASELYPYAKTGGLADVISSLANELVSLEQDVCLILPGYPALRAALEKRANDSCSISLGNATRYKLEYGVLPKINANVCLVVCDRVYGSDAKLYSTSPFNEFLRYLMLSHAAAYVASGSAYPDWKADILHAHDWHAGLAFHFLDQIQHEKIARVFTIHNLAFAGTFPNSYWKFVSEYLGELSGRHYENEISFLEEALISADKINTVSENYATEIQTERFGFGFSKLLQSRNRDLVGILNGVDYQVWHPEIDEHLPLRSYYFDHEEKAYQKSLLQQELGLSTDHNKILCTFTNRFAHQKMIDIIIESCETLDLDRFQFVFHGQGQEEYEVGVKNLAKKYSKSIRYIEGFNEETEHILLSASDVCLSLSRFEPCGLNALYAMRYGALPLVRPIGGFIDTVENIFEAKGAASGTGFFCPTESKEGVVDSLERIASLYKSKSLWRALVDNAKNQNFSWQKSAYRYLQLYKMATRKRTMIEELGIKKGVEKHGQHDRLAG